MQNVRRLTSFISIALICAALSLSFACKNAVLASDEPAIAEETAAESPSSKALTTRSDFREESIYFLMTTRFFDGDTSNNVRTEGDITAGNPTSDPSWRGDFKGLIQKLDYIKALGFSTVWITPVVTNKSGYDFHGYHAYDFNTVDPRLESSGYSFQNLIDECHGRDMKLVLDVVLNHSSSYGAKGLAESAVADFATRTAGLFGTFAFHDDWLKNWEDYTCQIGSIAGDCLDLDTENATVQNHLINAYNKYIEMGVDGFRIDTVKHVSRVMFNRRFVPAFMAKGGANFFMFGEVCTRVNEIWNHSVPPLSTPFYTWAERSTYSSADTAAALEGYNYELGMGTGNQPTSNNAFLIGNDYHAPDYSKSSNLAVIDFPMHWNFSDASAAFNIRGGDAYYNDATQNIVYVDSHDYGPNTDNRYAGGADAWAENFDLMFTWRGIPCVYYGSEVEFQAGARADIGTTGPLSSTGRAYFGDRIEGSVAVTGFGQYSSASGAMATTLATPLAKHLARLNVIRRAIPALQKGQYSTEGVSGNLAFKKRYTSGTTDSFVCVTISGNATFTGIPNGTYKDAITGAVATVTGGSLSTSGCSTKGDMRIYVLNGPGAIGSATQWLLGGGGGSSYSISGSVTNNGSGLSGVTVSSGSVSAVTGSGGAYTISGLTAGSYTLSASLSGYSFSPASTTVTISSANVSGVNFSSGFSAIYPSMNLRGTFNSWASTAMSLSANNTWKATVSLTSGTAYTYKFDVYGDWATNFGAGTTAGIAAQGGGNISYTPSATGSYVFTFNDSTKAYSVVLSGGSAPATPVISSVNSATSSSLTVTWPAVSGATSYSIYRATSSTGTYALVGTSTGTSFVDSGLSASTTYYYKVSASNSVGTSALSAALSGTTTALVVIPAVPVISTVNSATSSSLTVSWAAVSGATSYTVYRVASSTGTYASVGTSTGTSFVNTGLSASTTYWYKLAASNSAGSSAQSAAVSGTTTVGGFSSNYSAMYLRGSMNSWGATAMTLTANNTWTVSGVSLTASTAYTYKYEIGGATTWSTNWGSGSTAGIAALNGGNISYTPSSTTTYTFSFNDSTLAYSVVASGGTTIPAVPVISSVNSATTSSLTVSWAAVSGATSYTVYRSASSTGTYASVGTSTGTSFVNSGLTAATSYWYKVAASNSAGSSAQSAAVSGTTSSSSTTTTTIKITYDVGVGNTMYLRGSLSPLSWTTGIAMTWTTGNVWTYSTTAIASGAAFEFKGLINNATWSDGANFVGTGGSTITVTPTFNGNFYDTMDNLGNWTVSGYTGTGKWHIYSAQARAYACSTESLMTYKYTMSKKGTTVTLAYKYAVTGLDTGEYLAVDVSTNGGTTWTQVATYTGTKAATNASINVSAYQSDNFKIRFRTKMNSTAEYAYMDNVTVSVVK